MTSELSEQRTMTDVMAALRSTSLDVGRRLTDEPAMSDDTENPSIAFAGPAPQAANTQEPAAVPRLWLLFVLAWLPVLAISLSHLYRSDASPAQRFALSAGIAALAALYLLLTLRFSLAPEDLSAEGPSFEPLKLRASLLAAMMAIVSYAVWLRPDGELWWLTQHAIIAAGLAFPLPLAGWVIALLLALSLAASIGVTRTFDGMLLIQAAFGAAAAAIRSLTITVAQLRTAREELARLAVAEERLRFSRDLHDLLGHGLSLIVLKSELARRVHTSDPAQALREIADVERAAREALKQVRGAVAAYRQPTLEGEIDAAREVLAAAGIALTVRHRAGSIPPPADALLAWCVREGVTNVIRHSRAKSCQLHIERDGDRLWLELYDDGVGAGAARGEGHGLAGLRERARVCAGVVHAGPTGERGYRLAIELPALGGEP